MDSDIGEEEDIAGPSRAVPRIKQGNNSLFSELFLCFSTTTIHPYTV